MKEFNSEGLRLCEFQAALFEKSLDNTALSSPAFIKAFMNSALATHVDSPFFFNEDLTAEKILEEINSKYCNYKTQKKYSAEQMYWMGYLYRYWSFVYELSSKTVFSYIPSTELVGLYEAYHTLDCSAAIERIIEAKNIKRKTAKEKMVEIYGHI